MVLLATEAGGAQRTTPRTLPLLKVRSQRSAENFLTLFFIEVFCIFLFFGRRSQRTVGGVWALRGGRGGRAVFLLRLPAQNENGTARRAAQISNKQNNPTIWGVPHYHYPPRMPPAALEKKWGYYIVKRTYATPSRQPRRARAPVRGNRSLTSGAGGH